MGLAATQMRFLALTARKSNSEYQGQQINQQRLNLANQSSNIYNDIANETVPIPPDAGNVTLYPTQAAFDTAYAAYLTEEQTYQANLRSLEAESKGVQEKDKKLEMQLKRIDTEHSAIKTEIDAVKKILDDNVEASFKTFA